MGRRKPKKSTIPLDNVNHHLMVQPLRPHPPTIARADAAIGLVDAQHSREERHPPLLHPTRAPPPERRGSPAQKRLFVLSQKSQHDALPVHATRASVLIRPEHKTNRQTNTPTNINDGERLGDVSPTSQRASPQPHVVTCGGMAVSLPVPAASYQHTYLIPQLHVTVTVRHYGVACCSIHQEAPPAAW